MPKLTKTETKMHHMKMEMLAHLRHTLTFEDDSKDTHRGILYGYNQYPICNKVGHRIGFTDAVTLQVGEQAEEVVMKYIIGCETCGTVKCDSTGFLNLEVT